MEEINRLAELERKWRRSRLRRNPGPELTGEEGAERFRLRQRRRDAIRERFGTLFDWLIALLYRHDPVHLAPCGAPAQEYRLEAEMILPELDRLVQENQVTMENIREVVYRVFEKAFNVSLEDPGRYRDTCGKITDEVYARIAQETLEFIQAGRWQSQFPTS